MTHTSQFQRLYYKEDIVTSSFEYSQNSNSNDNNKSKKSFSQYIRELEGAYANNSKLQKSSYSRSYLTNYARRTTGT